VLLEITGIAPTSVQVERIKKLYGTLHPFDERSINMHLKSQEASLRGRFYTQKQSGHINEQQMRRYEYISLYNYILNKGF